MKRAGSARLRPPEMQPLEPRRHFAAGLPRPDHIVVVVEENHSYESILGQGPIPPALWTVIPPQQSTTAAYIQKLSRQGASLVNMNAETHPSQPNYLALFSGSTQNAKGDTPPEQQFTAPSLGGELIAAGLSFAGYSEDQPGAGFLGEKSGDYARKHNPWSDFTDVPPSSNLPFSSFPSDFAQLPAVSFVVPNQRHDMHSGSIRAADHWLKANLGAYAQWARKHNSLLVITWDEGSGGSNHIATIFYGSGVHKGQFQLGSDHYRVLRTIESMYGLAPLGNAATSAPLRRIFFTSTPAPASTAAPAQHADVFSQTPIPNMWQFLEGTMPIFV